MLDNAYVPSESSYKSNSSRILVIEYDEATWEAHVVFEYPIGVQMEYYGDADRLPTGNILASLWGLGDGSFSSYSQVFEVRPMTHERTRAIMFREPPSAMMYPHSTAARKFSPGLLDPPWPPPRLRPAPFFPSKRITVTPQPNNHCC